MPKSNVRAACLCAILHTSNRRGNSIRFPWVCLWFRAADQLQKFSQKNSAWESPAGPLSIINIRQSLQKKCKKWQQEEGRGRNLHTPLRQWVHYWPVGRPWCICIVDISPFPLISNLMQERRAHLYFKKTKFLKNLKIRH